ncbi:MAG TPA: Zn-dependent alcohol dehydrogenase, partial [Acidimicrobiia bacterium]|nr:Zn-dependent alcohol dehydrogenase [Acidimicrobiia bacterium]
VRMLASGVCHSDLSVRDGGIPHPLPAILGHEGAGVVEAVGNGVTRVAPGDRVVLSWMPACRRCHWCLAGQPFLCDTGLIDAFSVPPRMSGETAILPGMTTAAFAEATIVLEDAVVPVPADMPVEAAALIGCAVTTGVGAVVNTAEVRPGQSVAVVGCGGVGLSTVMGAVLAGASPIVAVDLSAERRALAADLGATHTVDPAATDPVAAVKESTGGRGADHAFEVVGRPETIRTSWDMAAKGGTVTLVGAGRPDATVEFNAMELFMDAKRLLGCVYGSADAHRDFPRFVELYRAGRLDLDRLVTARIGLDDLNAAYDAMAAGEGARSVITF